MSACLFIMSAAWFEKASRKEIEDALERWEQVIKESEQNIKELNNNKFLMDRYSGFTINAERADFVLIGMNKQKE